MTIDLAFSGGGKNDELVGIAANGSAFGNHRNGFEPQPRERAQVGHEHLIVGVPRASKIQIEGIGIFHQELACAHHTEARPDFVAELPLDVIEIER